MAVMATLKVIRVQSNKKITKGYKKGHKELRKKTSPPSIPIPCLRGIFVNDLFRSLPKNFSGAQATTYLYTLFLFLFEIIIDSQEVAKIVRRFLWTVDPAASAGGIFHDRSTTSSYTFLGNTGRLAPYTLPSAPCVYLTMCLGDAVIAARRYIQSLFLNNYPGFQCRLCQYSLNISIVFCRPGSPHCWAHISLISAFEAPPSGLWLRDF